MKIEIKSKNIEITEGINSAIKNELKGLDKYFKEEINATVYIKTYHVGKKIEIKLTVGDQVIRQETVERDLYAAIDVAVKNLEKQIRKIKSRATNHPDEKELFFKFFNQLDEKENSSKITKSKEIDLQPMSEEEAILQFEISGHDYFVYLNAQTFDISVLYKRKDGEYGELIIKG